MKYSNTNSIFAVRGNNGHSLHKNIINLRVGRTFVLYVVSSQSQQASPILFTSKNCEK
jgi:hypothetical protein